MKVRRTLVAVFLVGVCASQIASAREPLPPGSWVAVFIDMSGNVPEPDPGPPTDMMVFSGGRVLLAEVPGCSDTALPFQDAILVDRDGPRASRMVKVFIDQPRQAVPPGTRLTDFAPGVTCVSGGITYKKYTGYVD